MDRVANKTIPHSLQNILLVQSSGSVLRDWSRRGYGEEVPAGAIQKAAAFNVSTAPWVRRSVLTGALFCLILFLSGGEQAANELCGFLFGPFGPLATEEPVWYVQTGSPRGNVSFGRGNGSCCMVNVATSESETISDSATTFWIYGQKKEKPARSSQRAYTQYRLHCLYANHRPIIK